MVELNSLLASHGLASSLQHASSATMLAMDESEGSALLQLLLAPNPSGGPKVYVEWGSGGSTELVSWLILKHLPRGSLRAYSIESSVEWMASPLRRVDESRNARSRARAQVVSA